MKLKENGDRYMEGFGRRKEKGEMELKFSLKNQQRKIFICEL